jgi:bacillopeptidase F
MIKYSRLASVEEKKNIKKASLYLILSIAGSIVLVFYGLPFIINFAGFVGNLKKANEIEFEDKTPPAPPQFETIPEYTNSPEVEILGTSEVGATVIFRANNSESEVVTDNDGQFNFKFNLKSGENTIDAKAKDTANNQSTQTKTYKIIFDNVPPEITIENPQNEASFYGSNQRQLVIKGSINETKVNLTINDRFTSVDSEGKFIFSTTLQEGENVFNVKAVDFAGNETTTSFKVLFAS